MNQPARPVRHLWLIYLVGTIAWVIFDLHEFGANAYRSIVLYPNVFGLVILIANMVHQLIEPEFTLDYATTVHVYEYVERNTYYLIMAITIFLGISYSSIVNKPEPAEEWKLIVSTQAWAAVFCIFVLALIWMPNQRGREHCLVCLKHIKTVFYTYALSFFLIGPTELISKFGN